MPGTDPSRHELYVKEALLVEAAAMI